MSTYGIPQWEIGWDVDDISEKVQAYNDGTTLFNEDVDRFWADVEFYSDEFFIRVYDDTVNIKVFYNSLDEFIYWVQDRESAAVDDE